MTKPDSQTTRCWFLKNGKRIEEGIETKCKFMSGGGLEIYDVIFNGEVIGEIYAGSPQNMKEGYDFVLENVA